MTGGTTAPASGQCFACGEPVSVTDSFCEACGAELVPILVSTGDNTSRGNCSFCASSGVAPDGYCESCGRKVPAGRDHVEFDLRTLAGVTDRGVRHHRNEDAMALAVVSSESGSAAVAVVCDGVSTSARPDEASLVAVRSAARVLVTAIRTGEDPVTAAPVAALAAAQAVAALAGPSGDPPAATFVSAVLTGEAATVCWLGDSRAYWLASDPASASRQLTTDDSVARELIAAGMAEAEALASAQAHVVTRWLGADLRDAAPHVLRFEPPGPGVLLLCSDGLWNYQPDAAGLADLALPVAATDPLRAARALAAFAVDAGGADNVTVVLAPFPPARSAQGAR
ncbi:MAG TPA: protein phosphatase 2C domain-containing protein [Streptosporangiaceae bacterium]|nr:protein phosphatase 2C domain-containing protein [Streptosporangiaceae bacterium]